MPDTIMNTQEIHFLQQVKGYWLYLLSDYLVGLLLHIFNLFLFFVFWFCFLVFLVLTGFFCCYFYGLISSQGIITISND